MSQALLVAGLPGCGKTTYLKNLARRGYVTFDDFKNRAIEDSSAFTKSRHYGDLVSTLTKGASCAVADIDFCRREAREDASRALSYAAPGVILEWRFFANDVAACDANIRRRDRDDTRRALEKLREYARCYAVPAGAVVLPIVGKVSESAGC